MLSNKLTKVLATLGPKEFKKFVLYVESPFFNRNPRLITLVKLLERAHPDFSSPSLSRERVFIAMYGKKVPYNEQQVYDHVSFLFRLLEGFLAYQQYEQDPASQRSYMLRSFADRMLEDHFVRAHKKGKSGQEKAQINDHKHYLGNFLLSRESYRFFGKTHKRGFDDSLLETVTHLDVYYLAAKLRYVCDMYNRTNIINVDYAPELMDEIGSYLQSGEKPYLEIPAVGIYYRIYMMLTDSDNESHYQELVQLLEDHSEKFSLSEANDLYGYAQNYVIVQINRGRAKFFEELFTLYKLMLKKEMVIVGGYLDYRYYKNIATTGLRLKEYEWTGDFIESYKDLITPAYRDTAYFYNQAHFHYAQKQYNQALRFLGQADMNDPFYYLSVKSMLLQIYYETDEYDAMESLIGTFSVYLKRNKTLSRAYYQNHKNFLRFLKKAGKLRLQQGIVVSKTLVQQATDLLEQIESTGNIAYNSWLKNQVKELIGEKETVSD